MKTCMYNDCSVYSYIGKNKYIQYNSIHPCMIISGSCSSSKESITWLLSKEGTGNALVLVVGGAVEALEARPGSFVVNIIKRKGFVKVALQNG